MVRETQSADSGSCASPHHSTWMCASLISFVQRVEVGADQLAERLRRSGPRAARLRARALPARRAARARRSARSLSRLSIAGGIFAGPRMPHHTSSSNPGKPASDAVGSSGASGERCALVTARPRIFPEWMYARRRRERRQRHLQVAAHQVGERRTDALVRHVHELDLGGRGEQLGAEVIDAADARRCRS